MPSVVGQMTKGAVFTVLVDADSVGGDGGANVLPSDVYGTIVTTGKVTIADSATVPPLNVTERSAEPSAPAVEDVYLDDGTNTANTKPGWRRCVSTGPSVWEDVGGDVSGPGSSTDNAVARFNGTGGKTLQNSNATLGDTSILTLDNGSGVAIVITPAAATSFISMNGQTVVSYQLGSLRTNVQAGKGSGSVVALVPDNGSGVATIELNNGTAAQPTTVNVGSTSDSGASKVVVDTIESRQTNGNLSLAPNGTGTVDLGGKLLSAVGNWSAKGVIVSASGVNALSSLAVGDDDDVLTADSGEVTGLKWAPPAGVGGGSGTEIGRIVSFMPPNNASSNVAQGSNYAGGSTPAVVHRGVAFANGTDEYMDFKGYLFGDYDDSTSLVFQIPWMMKNDVSDTVNFEVTVGPIVYGTTDLDGDVFSGSTMSDGTDASGAVQGVPQLYEDTITRAHCGNILAGNAFVLRIMIDASGTGGSNDVLILPDIRVVYA